MRASSRATAVLAAVAAAIPGCAPSLWERTERFTSDGIAGRLYIPRVYAPLLPESIYPDRKAPLPAKGRPAIVVVCPEKGDCRGSEILEQAGRRGMVVLVLRRPPSTPLKIDLLRTCVEANSEHIGWVLVRPTGGFLGRWMEAIAPGTAAAVLEPVGPPGTTAIAPGSAGAVPAPAPPLPSSPSRQIFLLFSLVLSDDQPEIPAGAILKLYAARLSGGLPNEAYRDAVEWLAGELRAR